MSLEDLRVDVEYRFKKHGEPCPLCGKPLHESSDNFSCIGCGYVDWDNHNIPRTGVLVRAKQLPNYGTGYCNADIAELDDESLATWVFERLDDAGKLDLIRILLGRRAS